MGFTPHQIDRMSFWQLGVCAAGFNRANSAEEDAPAPSNDEFDQMLDRMNQIQDKRKMH